MKTTLLLALLSVGLISSCVRGLDTSSPRYYYNATCYHLARAINTVEKMIYFSDPVQLHSLVFNGSATRIGVDNACSRIQLASGGGFSQVDPAKDAGEDTAKDENEKPAPQISTFGSTPFRRIFGIDSRKKSRSPQTAFLQISAIPAEDDPDYAEFYHIDDPVITSLIPDGSESLTSVLARNSTDYDLHLVIHLAIRVIYDWVEVNCYNQTSCESGGINLRTVCENHLKPYWGTNATDSFGTTVDNSSKRMNFLNAMNMVWNYATFMEPFRSVCS